MVILLKNMPTNVVFGLGAAKLTRIASSELKKRALVHPRLRQQKRPHQQKHQHPHQLEHQLLRHLLLQLQHQQSHRLPHQFLHILSIIQ